ncbi:glutathione S-transferase [Sphingobium sp. SYK-6]|uniref:glutathione S-transferase family protein n=1 Tax=Sphingobium sp. (strain NBRC 103272 / SYK-6) TaxID=627192 RepID=UPI00022770DB|nr:glutathione S-transferase family protein [Sphingobium sp. SYK-6]BAK67508.1 glutathione S-transferase [Sphingobium sp. SYK-6]
MKLYDRQGTPNAARIRIVLAEKGLEDQVEFVTVDLIAAEQKQAWFLAMNPIGKTPVLVLDDGLVLSECTAITEYLDNLAGPPTLTGGTAREKGLIHMMQRRVEIMLLDPVDDYFHYGTPGLGPALRPWRQPDWAGAAEWGRRRGQQAVANLPYFDELLSGSPFLTGNRFTLPDISLFAALAFATGAGLPVAPGLRALADWQARVSALPAVKMRSGQTFLPADLERRRGE